MLASEVEPLLAQAAIGLTTSHRPRPASVSWYSDPRPLALGVLTTTPASSSERRRWVSNERDIPGTPREISVNVRQPSSRFRITRKVQRSARISAAREIGQYWP